jgi:hypothetical protein
LHIPALLDIHGDSIRRAENTVSCASMQFESYSGVHSDTTFIVAIRWDSSYSGKTNNSYNKTKKKTITKKKKKPKKNDHSVCIIVYDT